MFYFATNSLNFLSNAYIHQNLSFSLKIIPFYYPKTKFKHTLTLRGTTRKHQINKNSKCELQFSSGNLTIPKPQVASITNHFIHDYRHTTLVMVKIFWYLCITKNEMQLI